MNSLLQESDLPAVSAPDGDAQPHRQLSGDLEEEKTPSASADWNDLRRYASCPFGRRGPSGEAEATNPKRN